MVTFESACYSETGAVNHWQRSLKQPQEGFGLRWDRGAWQESTERSGFSKFLLLEVVGFGMSYGGNIMSEITAQLPDDLVGELDAAARELNRSRADLVRQAIERYLEDFDDLTVALKRLRDPTDPALDWDDVRHDVLGPD